MPTSSRQSTVEYGDFQTPPELAGKLCSVLAAEGVAPEVVLEPTCGAGSFLLAAGRAFPSAALIGADINGAHVEAARRNLSDAGLSRRVTLLEADFFETDWLDLLPDTDGPLLVVGNPPWVTSAEMGRIGGANLPVKSNIKGLRGVDAMTGAGNFDISEWMLLALLDLFQGRPATIAMLCKTAVSRKVIEHAANRELAYQGLGLWDVDAARHFGVSVAASFHVFRTDLPPPRHYACPLRGLDGKTSPKSRALGVVDGVLVSDSAAYAKWQQLRGADQLVWRSGIKHDCAAVMVLRRDADGGLGNGLGETPPLEEGLLYPFLRGSDIKQGRWSDPPSVLLVTQRRVGAPTAPIEQEAPLTWAYLQRHRDRLARRASSIYRGKPRFSIFGVGPYAFAPWKVVVSGLHKQLAFACAGPVDGKPVVLDDTCYFLGFDSEPPARAAQALLMSEPAQQFLDSLAFWDAKRPITKKLLEQLHLGRLARRALQQRSLPDHLSPEVLTDLAELAGD